VETKLSLGYEYKMDNTALEELAYTETGSFLDGDTNYWAYLATFLGGALVVLVVQMAIMKTPTPKFDRYER